MSELDYLRSIANERGDVAAFEIAADTIEKLRRELNWLHDIYESALDVCNKANVQHGVTFYDGELQVLDNKVYQYREHLKRLEESSSCPN